MIDSELKIRKLLWIRHGCSVGSLYGDDGEMQCNTCGIDFKRMAPEKIEELLIKDGLRLRKLYDDKEKELKDRKDKLLGC